MSNYLIFKPVNDTLDEVWHYSVETWGQKKAEEYVEGLFSMIKKAASREVLWRSLLEKIALDVYFAKYQRHYLFFRELEDDVISVVSIIHERRDIVSILEKEMRRLD